MMLTLGLWVRSKFNLSNSDVIIIIITQGSTCTILMLSLFFHSVVEFKDEEFVKKAIETMNKHDLSGRPLNIKEVLYTRHIKYADN